ncbi:MULTISPECIES: ABC transporter ATP-binding protein [Cyanophyceae]|uniref:ABC transporter ATP-binding protein n=1 Tax=Cyanophyceae TaxID=3028117 RepID=UPI0016851118|nr:MULTISPECIES: ABC transporter ATP-binding protein [Cyanophyceae]MBD1918318.1 ABC transporter ATP-binding protein [Phormidium sp. FACHB-77]MBD2028834.1 ABC transporter ATP-binding protein [Phormidium sp. FACHB-322]MBD2051255.1 ABC transporter ATP-binding protein [Leptolyngbya sp. FACHB-60]
MHTDLISTSENQQGEKGLSTGIEISNLTKRFHGETLYKNFNLSIPGGQFTSIFGPNGCGKSTLLGMISGLVPFDSGKVYFGGKSLSESKIGYVFQNYRDALFPWLRASDNITYPLARAGLSKIQRKLKLEELVQQFGVKFDLKRYPYELSGGQQQLVSIMRALATSPEVLFLDEPFSALDYEATLSIIEKLQEVFIASGVTMVMISHNLEEAIYLSNRVILLTKKPTHVAEIISFNAHHPRTSKTLSDPHFIDIKAHSLDVFRREVNK